MRVETTGFVGIHSVTPSTATILEYADSDDEELIPIEDIDIGASEYRLKTEDAKFGVDMSEVHNDEVEEHLVNEGFCKRESEQSEEVGNGGGDSETDSTVESTEPSLDDEPGEGVTGNIGEKTLSASGVVSWFTRS